MASAPARDNGLPARLLLSYFEAPSLYSSVCIECGADTGEEVAMRHRGSSPRTSRIADADQDSPPNYDQQG